MCCRDVARWRSHDELSGAHVDIDIAKVLGVTVTSVEALICSINYYI